ncbi:MAG TPA: hypothetical protein VM432_10490, partial [Bdellovibrionales bacterium]|nr:hypothetical protein [Bdellovibrionales bacterium]
MLGISTSAYADESLRVSYDEQTIKLGSQPLDDSPNEEGTVAARTQIVTYEFESDSPKAAEDAFKAAADTVEAMNALDAETYPFAPRNTIIVRITDGKHQAYPSAYQLLVKRLKPVEFKTHILEATEARRLTDLEIKRAQNLLQYSQIEADKKNRPIGSTVA